jgi:shikimate kinase
MVNETKISGVSDFSHRHGNIILTGASGSGKSAIGRQTAKLLGLGFLDLDEVIEKNLGRAIKDIVSVDGEEVFRELEMRALLALKNVRSHVVALGGGTLLSEESLNLAQNMGPIVWVQSSAGEIARRMFRRIDELEKRPLLCDLLSEENHEIRRDKLRQRIQKMLDDRRPWYSRADVVLDGSYVTPEMAAQHLKDILVAEGLIRPDRRRFSYGSLLGGIDGA